MSDFTSKARDAPRIDANGARAIIASATDAYPEPRTAKLFFDLTVGNRIVR